MSRPCYECMQVLIRVITVLAIESAVVITTKFTVVGVVEAKRPPNVTTASQVPLSPSQTMNILMASIVVEFIEPVSLP